LFDVEVGVDDNGGFNVGVVDSDVEMGFSFPIGTNLVIHTYSSLLLISSNMMALSLSGSYVPLKKWD